jgi:diaminopimelate decarboxylase
MAVADISVATPSYRDGRLVWYGCDMQQVAERFGTPCHVGCAEAVGAALRAFRAPFLATGLPLEVRFSVKTNPVPVFLDTLRREGAGFEVISTREHELLKRLGVPGDHVVATDLLLRTAVLDAHHNSALFSHCNPDVNSAMEHSGKGVAAAWCAQGLGVQMLTVTTLGQFRTLLDGADSLPEPLPIALGVCPELWRGRWDLTVNTGAKGAAIGFRPRSAELDTVLDGIATHEQLELVGLHMHIGSGIRSAAPYIRGIKVLEGVVHYISERRHTIRMLNIGGGFGLSGAPVLGAWKVVASLVGPGGAPCLSRDQSTLLRRVAEAVAGAFDRLERQGIRPEVLLVEPGRILSGPCQLLLLTVADVVDRGRQRRFLLCDGGAMAISPVLLTEAHRVMAVHDPGGSRRRYRVLGNLPSALDRVSASAVLPEMRPGDCLAVLDTGAYFVSMNNTFSGPRPPLVWIENGHARLARRRETDAELLARDILPGSMGGIKETSG